MSWSSTPRIGTVDLSGTTTITLRLSDYIVDHVIPGREGDITERVGRAANTLEIHGFLYSGSDAQMATLLSYVGTVQNIVVPSTASGQYFIPSGAGIIYKQLDFLYPGGKGHPYYEWVIRRAVVSGVSISNIIVFGITYVQPNIVAQTSFITYIQPNIVAQTSFIGYMQPSVVAQTSFLNYVSMSGKGT